MNRTKLMLRKSVWSQDKYYQISASASLDTSHPGMKILERYSQKAKTILDLGCGEGTRLNYLYKVGISALGIDISKKAILLAKAQYKHGLLLRNKKPKFVVGDLEELPLEDNSFDLVYSAWVLEHLSNPQKAINEAIRVTSKQGILVLICPNFGAPNRSSPPFKGSKIKKLIAGYFADLISLVRKTSKLDWQNVKPLADDKNYQIDWDTTVEPYLKTLKDYLTAKGLKVLEYSSCWDQELEGANIFQSLFKILSDMKIYPFFYWGPHALIVTKKVY